MSDLSSLPPDPTPPSLQSPGSSKGPRKALVRRSMLWAKPNGLRQASANYRHEISFLLSDNSFNGRYHLLDESVARLLFPMDHIDASSNRTESRRSAAFDNWLSRRRPRL